MFARIFGEGPQQILVMIEPHSDGIALSYTYELFGLGFGKVLHVYEDTEDPEEALEAARTALKAMTQEKAQGIVDESIRGLIEGLEPMGEA